METPSDGKKVRACNDCHAMVTMGVIQLNRVTLLERPPVLEATSGVASNTIGNSYIFLVTAVATDLYLSHHSSITQNYSTS